MRFQMISCTLVLLSLVSAVFANKGTCARTSPLAASLEGQTFSKGDDCYRPRVWNRVSFYHNMFILTVNDGVPLTCAEAYLVVYRKPNLTPMIVKYPSISVDLDIFGGSASGTDVENYCKKEQPKRKTEMFPVTETRGLFATTVKKMMPLLHEIRDYGCTKDKDGFWTQVKGRAYDNTDVQATITYLNSVAFQYQLCI